ncbi:NXPE family member 1-like [Pelobates cultripes]|uniref:NXPE family member 1-like n=1 Tax=Pelobates cultripes TaxID=61616 RepID=A0AAD1SYL0_PELCU|nr:NXPE family member 1-like [Pelobates cultripes]
MDVTESSTIHNSENIDREIYQIYNAIHHAIPNVSFTWLNKTTSATNSRAIILEYKKKYCIGDSLTVRVDMFDFLGKKKTYGGDFLRARIYSQNLGAGASGRIEDFNNGSYLINFTLSWEGNVGISIILLHPSEGVSVLWRTRNMGYENIIYIGKFLNKTQEIHKECGFSLESQEEKCEYADKIHGEFFYCLKPENIPCEALISLMTLNQTDGFLDIVDVGGNSTIEVKPKCRIGMSPPVPGGYFLKNVWHSLFCNLSSYEPLSQINECLSGKMIYLMGDSTIRQWIEYFPKLMKRSLKFFDLHGSGWHQQFLALDLERQVLIQWKKHGHPFVTQSFFTLKDYATVTLEIDRLAGGPHTIIVIALGQHFRPFPFSLFVRRLLNVRKAIECLFLRSPDTKVIIKLENTREINTDVERFSDFHGYIQYLLVKHIFKGLNIGMIDAWDMTVAFGSYNVHPPESVIKNQINMFLEYIC